MTEEMTKRKRKRKSYQALPVKPYGFITALAREIGKPYSRMTVSRALAGEFSEFSPYLGNFLAIREKACEMLGIENPDKKEDE